jgi:hypothetical protein
MRDNKYLTKITAASLLGDAGVYIGKTQRNNNAYFYINQIDTHKDYLEWLQERHNVLTNTRLNGPYERKCPDCKNPKPQYRLVTQNHPFYTKFRDRMYATGKKTVDPHYLTLIDYEFLAIWYQEDGTLKQLNENTPYGLYRRERIQIASMGFSYAENILLRESLKEKLGLIWNVRQQKSKTGGFLYYIELYKKQIDEFIYGVMPYIQPSFMYKVSRTVSSLDKDEEIV